MYISCGRGAAAVLCCCSSGDDAKRGAIISSVNENVRSRAARVTVDGRTWLNQGDGLFLYDLLVFLELLRK